MSTVQGMISVLCPTRLRQANVNRLLESLATTTATYDVEVVFRTDEDAPLEANVSSPRIIEVRGPRILFAQMWNEAYAACHGEIVMVCGDDIVFRTPGWDDRVRAEFAKVPDHIAVVYGNDLLQGANLASHAFVHRAWVEALGYLTPPRFSCDYVDTWIHDIAARIGRLRYMPDVITEHMHPVVGKALWDQTHQERLQRGQRDNVALLWEGTEPERASEAEKLRRLMAQE